MKTILGIRRNTFLDHLNAILLHLSHPEHPLHLLHLFEMLVHPSGVIICY
jgi:hypothetical protein